MPKRMIREILSDIQTYVPGRPIEEVKRELGLTRVIKLASNESPMVISAAVRRAIVREIAQINRYPYGDCFYLRMKLAKLLKIDPEKIIFGNGSDEIISLVLRTFVEPGCEEIIVGYPTFLMYKIQAQSLGILAREIPFKDFRYDLKAIHAAITPKTKVIIIANPDNPNGTYLTHVEVENFLKSIPRDIIVLFDEAYFEFAPADFPRTAEFLKQGYNVIFTRTFSKAYALAGLRIGYAVSGNEYIAAMNKVREPFNVNRLAQVAAFAALSDKKQLRKVIREIETERKFFYENFQKLGIFFVKSATNFILFRFSEAEKLSKFLLQSGVIIRDMRGWGMQNYLRVTIGTHRENQIFFKELSRYLAGESQ